MNVVGLDLSLTASGVALADGATTTVTSPGRTGAERLRHLRDEVLRLTAWMDAEWIETGAPPLADLVCIEGYSFGSRNGGERLGELGGVIRVALHERQVPYVEIAPKTIKTVATGKGNAAKEEVFAAAIRRLGYKGNSLDEADALWAREVALQHFGEGTAELPANHLRTLKDIEWPAFSKVAAS